MPHDPILSLPTLGVSPRGGLRSPEPPHGDEVCQLHRHREGGCRHCVSVMYSMLRLDRGRALEDKLRDRDQGEVGDGVRHLQQEDDP